MNTTTFLALSLLPVLASLAGPARAQREFAALEIDGRPPLEYALVLPDGYEPTQSYPALLALPPGDQTRGMVENGLELYWAAEARRRGWIVISPAATGRELFVRGGEVELLELLDFMAEEHTIEGGVFHLAGVSNGGRAAFRLALAAPERFASLTVLPGFATEAERARLGRLAGLPVTFYAGGTDEAWVQESRDTRDALVAGGNNQTKLVVFEGEGHVPASAKPELLFPELEQHRASVLDRLAAEVAVAGVLDELHGAAAKADARRYFALFAPNAVFLGTDAQERWNLAEFRAYAEPLFEAGQGWTYHARDRHVFVDPAGDTAWFDERLDHASYGELRGTGVLRRTPGAEGADGAWRIAQYNLAFPVPNDLARELGDLIRAEEARAAR